MSSTTTPARALADLYDSDGYSWAVSQADALRRRDFKAVDWDHVIEEIEDAGGRHEDSWTSLCEHFLLIEHHREAEKNTLHFRSREVRNFRLQMSQIIIKNRGLQGKYETMYEDAWRAGRESALLKFRSQQIQSGHCFQKNSAAQARPFLAEAMPLGSTT